MSAARTQLCVGHGKAAYINGATIDINGGWVMT